MIISTIAGKRKSKITPMKIYHNPRCSKSRQTLELLKEKGVDPEVVLYLDTPPSESELKRVLKLLGMNAVDLLRKNESIYKEQFKGQDHSDDEWIRIMVANPKLIERPIVVHKKRATIGRPPENVLSIL